MDKLIMAAITEVYTLPRVAEMIGEDLEWLREVVIDMDPEDGHLWIFGPGEEMIDGLTPFGLENLGDIVREYRANPNLMPRPPSPG